MPTPTTHPAPAVRPAPTKPPVTEQDDYDTALLPWIRRVQAALGIEEEALDVDRLHAMTGVVASEVQRSMAPISSYLVGLAVARGAALEEACAELERATIAASHQVSVAP